MPMIQPDFSEIVERGALPAGNYKVRVESSEVKTSKTSGNPYVNWKLITFGSDKPEWNNRAIFHSTPTMGKGAGILKQFLVAATGEVPVGGFEAESLYGRELQVVVEPELDRQTGEASGYVRVKSVAKL